MTADQFWSAVFFVGVPALACLLTILTTTKGHR